MSVAVASLWKPRRQASQGLPCDSCAGRAANICRPLDPTRLLLMLGLGGIRRWKQREIMFRAGDPIGSFFKIRRGIAAVSLGLDDGRERVAHFLAEFDAADSERSMPESSLALQIRRREIADYLGITVETLSRSLSQLRKRNVVRSNVDEIVVLDDERLCEIGKVSRPKSRSA